MPFTDLSSHKRRPVIVVSNDAYNRRNSDIVVVAMTSRPSAGPYDLRLEKTDMVTGALNRTGTIRVDKIYTLAKSIVVKQFGKVSPTMMDQIRERVRELTDKRP